MTTTTTLSYTLGKFVWRELFTHDVAAAKRYYGALFGWTFEERPMGPEFVYTLVYKGDKQIAGMMAIADMPGGGEGIPTHWATYVSVEDVDATAKHMVSLGAKVLGDCHDIPGVGRFAIMQDPFGAHINLFRSANGDPADTRPTPGEFNWENLSSPDPAASAEFYRTTIGWQTSQMPSGTIVFNRENGSTGVASLGQSPDGSSNWLPFVDVTSAEAACAQARELGGTVVVEPTPIPGRGAFAFVQDPFGAFIAVFESTL